LLVIKGRWQLVSFRFVFVDFVSFLFRFALYRYPKNDKLLTLFTILIVLLKPLQYSSRTLPATQFKSGLLADKLSEVQMSYFYLCLSVCQYLWIIKFLEWRFAFVGFVLFRWFRFVSFLLISFRFVSFRFNWFVCKQYPFVKGTLGLGISKTKSIEI
jgi:hypothetical protein